MKKLKLISILLLFSVFTRAQNDSSITHYLDSLKNPKNENEKIYSSVDQMPLFPGGIAELYKFLNEIKYPKKAKRNGIYGRVYVSFIVNSEGHVVDAKIIRGLGYGIDEEVLHVINKMPDWEPGKVNDRRVSVQYNLPVNFNLKRSNK